MIVVDIHPDGFKKAAGEQAAAMSRPGVRRPTRGIVLKEDTFATIKVVTSNGALQSLVDGGSRAINENNEPLEINGKRANSVYSNFLVQQVNEERAEKAQILETFGEPYIFLFGERARVISVQGILANTWDFNWEAEWWFNYENYLRGTKCVENDAMVFLQFDDSLVGGYIIGSTATKLAQERNYVQFNFQMFVTFQTNLSDIGNRYATKDFSTPMTEFTADGEKTGYVSGVSVDEAIPMRPPLLYPSQYAVQMKTDGTSIEQPDLFASVMQFAVNPLKKAWSFANNAVNRVTSAINTLTQTGMVEVPYGFAGSMVYDEADLAQRIRAVQVGGFITYTTFADNDDEYVDAGNQYASSDTSLFRGNPSDPVMHGFDGTLGRSGSVSDEIRAGWALTEAAEDIWLASGKWDPDARGVLGTTGYNGVAKAGWGLVQVRGLRKTVNINVREKTGLQFKSVGYGRILNGIGAQALSGPKLPGWG